jgi:hypothetical protein
MLREVNEPLNGDTAPVHQGSVTLILPAVAARGVVLPVDLSGFVALGRETVGVIFFIEKGAAVAALRQV